MQNEQKNQNGDLCPSDRIYRLDIKRCMIRTCGGELAELSCYKRNNRVTIEYKCTQD